MENWQDPAYTAHDAARFLPEPPKNPARTAFQRDRARLLHSSGLRRLGAKTQVVGPSSNDFARTRLTHSLEVAQVGRELGDSLGCNPDVVDTACLAHDIGHPPFGHNGERALNEVAEEIGGFEGNAQTLRLLTRLEAKSVDLDGRSVGLNLTRASLDATSKYPWAAGDGPAQPDGSPSTKYGVYPDDAEIFLWLREGAPAGERCLEAQVMDLADDIAYSVHDVEDGVASGKIPLARLARDIPEIVEETVQWYGAAADEVGAALERLMRLPYWMREFDSTRTDLARLKNVTSALIGRFSGAAHDWTRERYGQERLSRYGARLVVPTATRAEILALKGIAVTYVMAPRELDARYLSQRTVLFDLADVLWDSRGEQLEVAFQEDWRRAEDDRQRLRVLVDQLASLTDSSANQWHARLCGMISTAF